MADKKYKLIINTNTGSTTSNSFTIPSGGDFSVKQWKVDYQASSTGTAVPSGTWLETVPNVSQGAYLWTRTSVIYSDGTITYSYTVARQGVDGSASSYKWIPYFKNINKSEYTSSDSQFTISPETNNYNGWTTSITDPDKGYYTWMWQLQFNGDTYVNKSSQPVRLTGLNGEDSQGEDAESFEFIYQRTYRNGADAALESATYTSETGWTIIEDSTLKLKDDYVPTGWTDNPKGITELEFPYEWCAVRYKVNGTWGSFSNPFVWSAWGTKGRDGDGVEYIYLLQENEVNWSSIKTNLNPNIWTAYNNSDSTLNYGYFKYKTDAESADGTTYTYWWTDNPTGVNGLTDYEYVSVRKRDSSGQWGKFTVPALWSHFGQSATADSGLITYINNDNIVVPCKDSGYNYAMSADENNIYFYVKESAKIVTDFTVSLAESVTGVSFTSDANKTTEGALIGHITLTEDAYSLAGNKLVIPFNIVYGEHTLSASIVLTGLKAPDNTKIELNVPAAIYVTESGALKTISQTLSPELTFGNNIIKPTTTGYKFYISLNTGVGSISYKIITTDSFNPSTLLGHTVWSASDYITIWVNSTSVVTDYIDWESINVVMDGKSGVDGKDSDTKEFIYARTSTSYTTGLTNPNTLDLAWGSAPNSSTGLFDNPQGVTSSLPYEWFWIRTKSSEGVISSWSGPTLWSHYGKDGKDGDGIEYIYSPVNVYSYDWGNGEPSTWTASQDSQYIPTSYKGDTSTIGTDTAYGKWFTDPVKLWTKGTYQYVSVRKKRIPNTDSSEGDSALWEKYSTPALWNYYPVDGTNLVSTASFSLNQSNPIVTFVKSDTSISGLNTDTISVTRMLSDTISTATINSITLGTPTSGITASVSGNVITANATTSTAIGPYEIPFTVVAKYSEDDTKTVSLSGTVSVIVVSGAASSTTDNYTVAVTPIALQLESSKSTGTSVVTYEANTSGANSYIIVYKNGTIQDITNYTISISNETNCTTTHNYTKASEYSGYVHINSVSNRTITGGTVDATTGKNVDVSIPYNTGSYTVDITTPDGQKYHFIVSFTVNVDVYQRDTIDNVLQYQTTFQKTTTDANNSIKQDISQIKLDASGLHTLVETAQTTANNANTDLATVKSTYSTIDQTSSSINAKIGESVTSGGQVYKAVASSFSMSGNGISLFGKELNIAGATIFSSYATTDYVDNAGYQTSADVNALILDKGYITSPSVKSDLDSIGLKLGYTGYDALVAATSLRKTLINGGYINTMLIDTDALTAQTAFIASLKSKLITAENINSVAIDAGSIKAGTLSANRIDTTSITSLGEVKAGSFNIGSGKFTVTSGGALTATNATVTGDITANTLNIALSTNSSTVTDASSLDDSTIATLAANGSMAFKNTSGSLVAFFSYEGVGVYLYMKNPESGKWYRVDFLKWKQCSNSVSSIAIPLYNTTQIQSVLGNSISPASLTPTTTIYKALETKNSAVKGFVYTDSDCTTLVTSTYLSNCYLLSNSFNVLQKSFGKYYLLSGNYKYINAILKGGSTQTTSVPGITYGSTQYIIGNQWLNANATNTTVSTAGSDYKVLDFNGTSYAVSSITWGQNSYTLSSALTCDSYVNEGSNNFVTSLTGVSTSNSLTPVTFNGTSSTTGTLTENTNIFDSTYVSV